MFYLLKFQQFIFEMGKTEFWTHWELKPYRRIYGLRKGRNDMD